MYSCHLETNEPEFLPNPNFLFVESHQAETKGLDQDHYWGFLEIIMSFIVGAVGYATLSVGLRRSDKNK